MKITHRAQQICIDDKRAKITADDVIAALKQLRFNTMSKQLIQTFSHCLKNDHGHDIDSLDHKTNTHYGCQSNPAAPGDDSDIEISQSNAKMGNTNKNKGAKTEKNVQADVSMKSASVEY